MIVSDFLGKNFEFYKQEGNDLIFYDKIELEEKDEIKMGNRLYKLKDNYFVAINHNGDIFVFNIKKTI